MKQLRIMITLWLIGSTAAYLDEVYPRNLRSLLNQSSNLIARQIGSPDFNIDLRRRGNQKPSGGSSDSKGNKDKSRSGSDRASGSGSGSGTRPPRPPESSRSSHGGTRDANTRSSSRSAAEKDKKQAGPGSESAAIASSSRSTDRSRSRSSHTPAGDQPRPAEDPTSSRKAKAGDREISEGALFPSKRRSPTIRGSSPPLRERPEYTASQEAQDTIPPGIVQRRIKSLESSKKSHRSDKSKSRAKTDPYKKSTKLSSTHLPGLSLKSSPAKLGLKGPAEVPNWLSDAAKGLHPNAGGTLPNLGAGGALPLGGAPNSGVAPESGNAHYSPSSNASPGRIQSPFVVAAQRGPSIEGHAPGTASADPATASSQDGSHKQRSASGPAPALDRQSPPASPRKQISPPPPPPPPSQFGDFSPSVTMGRFRVSASPEPRRAESVGVLDAANSSSRERSSARRSSSSESTSSQRRQPTPNRSSSQRVVPASPWGNRSDRESEGNPPQGHRRSTSRSSNRAIVPYMSRKSSDMDQEQ